MCLLALFFRAVDDAPVIVGANREEYFARGGEPPRLLPGQPRIVAGIDPVAGGSWLGVNEFGVLVAVTNRRKSLIPPMPRSRGLLVRELLASPSAGVAADRATRELDKGLYAGCNLLCVDAERAVIIQAGDWLRVRPLPSGLHVLSNGDVNDEGNRRVGHALWALNREQYKTADDCLSALQRLCSDAGPADAPMCIRGKDGGTVSSTLIAVRSPPARGTLFHAQGPPDLTPYVDSSDLLGQLGPISNGTMSPEGK